MPEYVALLRGINVGGKNLIRMSDLKACFQDQGFGEVGTYIQSGNVLFTARGASRALTSRIEGALAEAFRYRASVVLVSRKQMRAIVAGAPPGFGAQPGRYRYDVLFLKPPLQASAALRILPVRDGVDRAHAGTGVIYFSRLVSRAAQSQLVRVVSMPIYKQMTIRNWNTTTKLLERMEQAAVSAPPA